MIMKRTIVFIAAAVFLLGMVDFSYASGRHGDRHRGRDHRHGESTWYSRYGNPGISIMFSFPGTVYRPYRRHYEPPRRVWVPGYWEYERVWIPGRVERNWRPGRRGPYGYSPGFYEERTHGGDYRMKKVWREGRYR